MIQCCKWYILTCFVFKDNVLVHILDYRHLLYNIFEKHCAVTRDTVFVPRVLFDLIRRSCISLLWVNNMRKIESDFSMFYKFRYFSAPNQILGLISYVKIFLKWSWSYFVKQVLVLYLSVSTFSFLPYRHMIKIESWLIFNNHIFFHHIRYQNIRFLDCPLITRTYYFITCKFIIKLLQYTFLF